MYDFDEKRQGLMKYVLILYVSLVETAFCQILPCIVEIFTRIYSEICVCLVGTGI